MVNYIVLAEFDIEKGSRSDYSYIGSPFGGSTHIYTTARQARNRIEGPILNSTHDATIANSFCVSIEATSNVGETF